MQLLRSILLAWGLTLVPSSVAMAAVSPNNTHAVLSKRLVDNLPPSDMFIDCNSYGGYLYAAPQVMDAIQKGIGLTEPPGRLISPIPSAIPRPVDPTIHGYVFTNLLQAASRMFSAITGGCPSPTFARARRSGSSRCWPTASCTTAKTLDQTALSFLYTPTTHTDPTMHGAYCGVMTHVGAPQGEFTLCTVED
jgi:hypothetical protein